MKFSNHIFTFLCCASVLLTACEDGTGRVVYPYSCPEMSEVDLSSTEYVMANDTLYFSVDIKDEQTPLSVRLFNLSETLEKLLRLTVIPVDKHVRFETQLTPEQLWVAADSVHLTNSISNLVENAIKYSGNEVCIRISASLTEGKLVIQVADNGFGISPQDQLHIFDKFYRSEQGIDRSLPGIGLGLSYVKLMVEAHGGTVGVESILGKGSVFTLEIPQSK